MALIKQSTAGLIAREAIVLDLGDLQRQADLIISQAKAQARKIAADSQAQRERTVAGASEIGQAQGFASGFQEGHEAGVEKGREEAIAEFRSRLEVLESAWTEALVDFNHRRQLLLDAAERDVVRLATVIAERVIKRALHLDPEIVVDQVRAVLQTVARPTELVLAIHPGDRMIVEQALPKLLREFPNLRHASIIDDPDLAPGSCIAQTRASAGSAQVGSPTGTEAAASQTSGGSGGSGGGTGGGGEMDASIATQLDRIVAALLPEPSRGTLSM